MNENGKCIRNPILVLPQKSLHPPHEKFRPVVPILLEHACIPRFLKPFEVVLLCWGQALAEAGESIQNFQSVLLRSGSTDAFLAHAQVLERVLLDRMLRFQHGLCILDSQLTFLQTCAGSLRCFIELCCCQRPLLVRLQHESPLSLKCHYLSLCRANAIKTYWSYLL